MKYDVFVIGTGLSGSSIAEKCASKGLRTGIADMRPFGGTCALRGCDPKKILVDAAKLKEEVAKHSGKGVAGNVQINWADLMAFKNRFTDPVPEKSEKSLLEANIGTYHGPASFQNEETLQIGDQQITAEKIVIATGAKPRKLNIPGEAYTITSNDFLNLNEVPDSITFLGGGYIAFEFAHVAAKAGAKVTIIERGERPLKKFEKEITDQLIKASEEAGISIIVGSEAKRIDKTDDRYKVSASGKNDTVEIETQLVINTSGRIPEIDQLHLERANIKANGGIEVNEFLQSTSNPNVYAAGDVTNAGGLPLTPVAIYESALVAENIVNGSSGKLRFTEIPTVVFTIPAMASVGLTEAAAAGKKMNYEVKSGDASSWYNGKRTLAKNYAYKILIDKNKDTILGAHLIGPYAEETINLFALAIKAGMTSKELKNTIFTYPSFASDVQYML